MRAVDLCSVLLESTTRIDCGDEQHVVRHLKDALKETGDNNSSEKFLQILRKKIDECKSCNQS